MGKKLVMAGKAANDNDACEKQYISSSGLSVPSTKDLKGVVVGNACINELARDGSCHLHVLTFCNEVEVYGQQFEGPMLAMHAK